MPSEMEVELDVAPDPLQCVRSDAHDTGALYVHTILPHTTVRPGYHYCTHRLTTRWQYAHEFDRNIHTVGVHRTYTQSKRDGYAASTQR